jgi:hypothetical protein
MGVSNGDASCLARNYVKWVKGRLNVPAVKHSDSRSVVLAIKSHHRCISRKRMT